MFEGSENPATKRKKSEIPGNHFKNTISCDLSLLQIGTLHRKLALWSIKNLDSEDLSFT